MMMDTIHIELPPDSLSQIKLRKRTEDCATRQILSEVDSIDCIKVKRTQTAVYVECSLPKLLKGNNVYILSHKEVLEALQLIESKLGVDLSKGIVKRIDLAVTIEVEYSPAYYFQFLGDSRYFTRLPVGKTSLYYSNDSRELYFYDKVKEMQNKKNTLALEFTKRNLLRVEYRVKKKSLKRFFGRTLHVEDLRSATIAESLVNELRRAYRAVNKIPKPTITDITEEGLSSSKGLLCMLAKCGIEALGGTNEVMTMIDQVKLQGLNVRAEYLSRRRKEIRSLTIYNGIEITDKPIDELDSKFEEMCSKFLA